MYKDNKGYQYEEIAKRYLLKNNYKILEQNFTSKFGEIDIIALKDGIISFIEVKGRKNIKYGLPREAVTISKQKKIISCAKFFLLQRKYSDIQCQFDVIEIILDDKVIEHIEDAFCT
ncbi:YraN family protein [Sedimentibacter acidaminivorans]|nr:YraN family protein [Sedimentibacter acidaminivorans]